MKNLIIFSLLHICTINYIVGQNLVKGYVIDEKNTPISYANVFLQSSPQEGSITNQNGFFDLTINTQKQQDTIIVKFIGYQPKKIAINQFTSDTLKIQLTEDSYLLSQILVVADRVSFARNILQKASKKRKINQQKIVNVESEVYMKCNGYLNKIPALIWATMEEEDKKDLDTGLVYAAEAILKYQKNGDSISEITKASFTGGNDMSGLSFNSFEEINFDFYEKLIPSFFYERGLISPLHNDRNVYYTFYFEGTVFIDDRKVHKIKVIPRRKYDPIFKGVIYIDDKTYEIAGIDLVCEKPTPLEFANKFSIQKDYTFINGVWYPAIQKLLFEFNILGIEFNYDCIAYHKNLKINEQITSPLIKNQESIIALDTNSLYNQDKNIKDSIFWENNRPIEISSIEKKYYVKTDSLQVIKDSIIAADTIFNKKSFTKKLISYPFNGKIINNDSIELKSKTFLGIDFNSTEGWVISPNLYFERKKILKTQKKTFAMHKAYLQTRYAFAQKKYFINGSVDFILNSPKILFPYYFKLSGGRKAEQVNKNNPVIPSINAFYALFDVNDQKRIYDNQFINIKMSKSLSKQMKVLSSINYAYRGKLDVATEYTFVNKKGRNYEPNNPTGNNTVALNFDVYLKYEFKNKYLRANSIIIPPTLSIYYNKGIETNFTSTNYDLLEIALTGKLNLGLVGKSNYQLKAGSFLNHKLISDIDKKHFMGNRTFLIMQDGMWGIHNQFLFQNLEYYNYSTNSSFSEIHFQHHFNGFILNKIPLIRKLKWQTVTGVNSLFTKEFTTYNEVYIGIENIFKILRIDMVGSINDKKFVPYIKLGVDFGVFGG